jgi:hypothetical protein
MRRTGQIDPLLPFKIGPRNGREARESGLWPKARRALHLVAAGANADRAMLTLWGRNAKSRRIVGGVRLPAKHETCADQTGGRKQTSVRIVRAFSSLHFSTIYT